MEKRKVNKLIFLLWFLNIFDALATHYAVNIAHYAYEANPLMRPLVSQGLLPVLLLKTLSVFCCWYSIGKFYDVSPKFTKWLLYLSNGFYGLVALWHVFLFMFVQVYLSHSDIF